jgi:hypothetical protein
MRPSKLLSRYTRVGRRFGDVVTYMLSETAEGWALYDDEGRTQVLTDNLNSALLDAARIMRDHGDPVHGGWALASNEEVMALRFTPAE